MSQVVSPSRRQFIKTFALGTAFSRLLGKPWVASVLADIQPAGAGNIGKFSIRLSDFPALLEEGGSVRLSVNPIGFDEFPIGNFWPIIINRGVGDQFFVLDSEGTHASCIVAAYDRFFNLMGCPCHGSLYDIDGTVISPGEGGSPDQAPLRRFNYSFDGVETLTIEVPGLGYTVRGTTVETGTGPRFRLIFPTFPEVAYEVHSRSSVNVAWTPINFAFTATGPANQTVLIGTDQTRSVYVPRTAQTGFYAVAIRLLDLT